MQLPNELFLAVKALNHFDLLTFACEVLEGVFLLTEGRPGPIERLVSAADVTILVNDVKVVS